MKVELLQPSEENLPSEDLGIDLSIRVTDDRNSPVADTSVIWLAHGHEHRFDSPATVTDPSGIAKNKLVLSAASKPTGGALHVRTADNHIYEIGSFQVTPSGPSGESQLRFQPLPARLVASPPARVKQTIRTNGDSLTIYYPTKDVKLPWGVTQYAWVLYLDGNGNPITDKSLEVKTDGDIVVGTYNSQGNATTDKAGWALIPLQVTNQLAENPPFGPQDATGTLYVKSTWHTTAQAQAPITFSTTMGGRGYLYAVVGDTAPQQGKWFPVTVKYLLPDGTPAKHKQLNWVNNSSSYFPVSFSTSRAIPPKVNFLQQGASYTDENGDSTLYFLALTTAQSSYYNPSLSVNFSISGRDVLSWSGDTTAVSIAPSPPSTTTTTWPIIEPNDYAWWTDQNVPYPLNLTFTNSDLNAQLEGVSVTWGVVGNSNIKLAQHTTQISGGRSANSVTGSGPDPLYTATIYAEIAYPANAPQRTYASINFRGKGWDTLNQGTLSLLPPPSSTPLQQGVWYPITAQYSQTGYGAGQAVRWYADPNSNIEFKSPYPSTMDSTGKCSTQFRAVGLSGETRIAIFADAYNPHSGSYDTAYNIYLFSNQCDGSGSIVVNPVSPQPQLYAPATVTARYTKCDGTAMPGAYIQWTGYPENTISFSPNISQTDGDGNASTVMTAYGPNQATTLTVVASSYDETAKEMVAGSLAIPFKAGTPNPQAGRLDIVSLEGDPLWSQLWHLLQVNYLYQDGTPITGKRQISWKILTPLDKGILLQESSTWTDDNGVATNMIQAPSKIQGDSLEVTIRATVTNPVTNQPETGDLTLILTANNVEAVSKVMTITVDSSGGVIESGYPCPITVKYLQPNLIDPVVNAPITWAVYPYMEDGKQPPYELIFGQQNPTYTGTDGTSKNTITYSGTKDLNGAILIASSFNPVTGATDFAKTILTFKYVSPVTGIMIDRPWAKNPDAGNVNPSIPCQVVTAKMTLAKGLGGTQIGLRTDPADLPTQIFKTDNSQITPTDDLYLVPITDGSAEIRIGATYPASFKLNAYYPPEAATPVCTTDLMLSTIGGKYGDTRWQLIIQNLDTSVTPPLLTMPDPSLFPAPTFTASLPANGNGVTLDPTANVQILLNSRIAYAGKVGDVQLPNSADIAYAMLQPTGNVITYVVGSGNVLSQEGYLTFDATGKAQIAPTSGKSSQIFPAPSVVLPSSSSTIQATDIINGLSLRILPSSTQQGWTYQPGDVITAYYYLSGTYPLTKSRFCPGVTTPIYNIAYVTYTVVQGDELTTDRAKVLDPLPQKFLAGYNAGQLTTNFKVVRNGTTYWSKAGTNIKLNTGSVG